MMMMKYLVLVLYDDDESLPRVGVACQYVHNRGTHGRIHIGVSQLDTFFVHTATNSGGKSIHS